MFSFVKSVYLCLHFNLNISLHISVCNVKTEGVLHLLTKTFFGIRSRTANLFDIECKEKIFHDMNLFGEAGEFGEVIGRKQFMSSVSLHIS